MSFFIDHPDEWIGVPEHWPFDGATETASDPDSWIADLAESLPEDDDAEGREHLRRVLTMAVQHAQKTGLRTFVAFEQYGGPGYVVESGTFEGDLAPGQTLMQRAGFDDEDQVGEPFAEEFATASGLVGVRCYRYLRKPDFPEALMGRVDYLFHVGRSMLFIRGAEYDLVFFERLKRAIELLAVTVVWRED